MAIGFKETERRGDDKAVIDFTLYSDSCLKVISYPLSVVAFNFHLSK